MVPHVGASQRETRQRRANRVNNSRYLHAASKPAIRHGDEVVVAEALADAAAAMASQAVVSTIK